MLILIKDAGDIASGVAYRLHRAGYDVVMTDLPKPTAIRRTICFSEAIIKGETTVEHVTAVFARDAADADRIAFERHRGHGQAPLCWENTG